MKSPSPALLVFALAVAPSPVRAGGFSYPDLGTAALSRGGAFVARADDPTAAWYNVAGVGRIQGTHLLLDVNVFSEHIHYQRRIYPTPGTTVAPPLDRYPHDPSQRLREVQNDDAPFPIPILAGTTDLGGWLRPANLVLVGAFYGPNAHPSRTYPRHCDPGAKLCEPGSRDNGLPNPARYDTLKTRILVLNPSVGLAWRPLPSFAVGATFQAAYARFSIEKMVAAFIGADEDPVRDILVRVDARDLFTPTGNLGVHWQPVSWLELGATFQLPVRHRTTGKVRVEIPASLSNLGVEASPNPADVEVKLDIPAIARFGVRYVHRDAEGREHFDLEVDATWESTSDLEMLSVDSKAGLTLGGSSKILPLGVINQRYQWRDTWGLRLGGSHRFHGLWPGATLILRGGLFYESSAAPDEYLRLDFIPLARLGLTLGVGLKWGAWRFGVGYAHLFHPTREVSPGPDGESGSRAIVIIPLSPDAGHPVGNGTYRMSVDLFTFDLMLRL